MIDSLEVKFCIFYISFFIIAMVYWIIMGYIDKSREIDKKIREEKILDKKYDIIMKNQYNKYVKLNYDLEFAKKYRLIDDFFVRANCNPHYVANKNTNIKFHFSGDNNNFNGFLILDKNLNPKQFVVLILEEKTFDVNVYAGDIIYYLNCKLSK